MNLSHKMNCPACGKEMGNGGCNLGGELNTYNRTCSCGCTILCVPMKTGKHYKVTLVDDLYEKKYRELQLKVKECRAALERAEKELNNL